MDIINRANHERKCLRTGLYQVNSNKSHQLMMLTLNINDKYFDIVDRLQPIIC